MWECTAKMKYNVTIFCVIAVIQEFAVRILITTRSLSFLGVLRWQEGRVTSRSKHSNKGDWVQVQIWSLQRFLRFFYIFFCRNYYRRALVWIIFKLKMILWRPVENRNNNVPPLPCSMFVPLPNLPASLHGTPALKGPHTSRHYYITTK